MTLPVPPPLPDPTPPAIEITGLTKRYGAYTVVSDLTFGVRPGSVTGFLGPNGAGKPNNGL